MELGQVVGGYRIVGRLGQGGMGAVYRAEHELLGRPAAVKVLLPELSSDPVIVGRFFDEARATARLAHPGIVNVHDFGHCTDGSAYLVMELLIGESLRARLGRGPLPWFAAIAHARGIADALAAAHQAGIVHRDLKPDNVFIVAGGDRERIKVLDFGVAKLGPGLARRTAYATCAGALLGTPTYMSPQQCRGVPDVDHRADVYALGCILFEMVCGRPPFVADSLGVLIAAHTEAPVPSPRALRPELPPALDALIVRSLAKHEGDRQQSMLQLIDELDQVLVSNGPPPGWGTRRPDAPTVVPTARSLIHAAPARPWARRLVGLVLAGAVAGGAIATVTHAPADDGAASFSLASLLVQDAGASTTDVIPPAARPAPRHPVLSVVPLGDPDVAGGQVDVMQAAGIAVEAAVRTRDATPATEPPRPSRSVTASDADRASAMAATPGWLVQLFTAIADAPAAHWLDEVMRDPAAAAEPSASITLRITSSPTGAQIAYDGAPIGAAPIAIEVARGDYTIPFTLSLAGHLDRTIELPAIADRAELVELAARPRVRLLSRPSGAQVVDGGTVVGTTPLELSLAPDAPRTVTLRLAGHVDREVTLTPTADGVRSIDLAVVPRPRAAPCPRRHAPATDRPSLVDPYDPCRRR